MSGIMLTRTHVVFLIGVVLYLLLILLLLRRGRLTVRYAILWLASGVVLLLFALFPYLVLVLRDLTGVEVVSNLIFILIIAFMLLILLSLSAALSTLSEKVKRLTQANALLEERLRRLEEKTK